jgi:hypothetical protein
MIIIVIHHYGSIVEYIIDDIGSIDIDNKKELERCRKENPSL